MKILIKILPLLLLLACSSENDNNTIEESGTIETKEVLISAKTGGTIIKKLFNEGDKVKAGDTLIILDTEALEIQLMQTIAAEKAANAIYKQLINGARKEDIKASEELLKQAKANYENAEKDYIRMKNLYDSKAITKKQFDDAETRYTVTKSQLKAAEESYTKNKNIARPEELEQAKANLDKATAAVLAVKKNIKDCYITAPIPGVISENFFEIGELVVPSASLCKINNPDDVEIKIYVSETVLGKVKIGQKALISVDTFPNKTYEGKVIYISPNAEFTPKNIQTKEERTKLVYAVKIKVKNDNSELKNGMPADAKIIL